MTKATPSNQYSSAKQPQNTNLAILKGKMTNPQNPTTQTLSSASNPHSPRPKWLRSEGEHSLHEGEAGKLAIAQGGPRPSPKVESNL